MRDDVGMTGGGFFNAVQNFTFYILHFTFKVRSFGSVAALPHSGWQGHEQIFFNTSIKEGRNAKSAFRPFFYTKIVYNYMESKISCSCA